MHRPLQPAIYRPAAMASDLVTLNGGVLPADVMYEILLRVPAKALCRLRLVCRWWRSITSDPRFAGEHLPRHPLFVGYHFLWAQIHIVDMSGDIVKLVKRIRSFEGLGFFDVSTQGDLICLVKTFGRSRNQACLHNPATGAINALPAGGIIRTGTAESACVLGHVPSTGEYKVLRIGIDYPPAVQRCEVITLGGGGGDQTWREKSSPPILVSMDFRSVAVVGGVAYFLLSGNFFADDNTTKPGSSRIALFDLVTEEWRPAALQGPMMMISTKPADDYLQLAKLNDCLAMAYHNYQHWFCSSLDLWFLIDVDRCLWNKRYSLQQCAPHHWSRRLPPYPLAVLDDGKVVIWLERQRVLKAYDPRIGTWADLGKLEDYYFVGMYEGSLLCSGLQN